jgi:hypothetical protein
MKLFRQGGDNKSRIQEEINMKVARLLSHPVSRRLAFCGAMLTGCSSAYQIPVQTGRPSYNSAEQIKFQPGTVKNLEGGSVRSGVLLENTQLHRFKYRAGTEIVFSKLGTGYVESGTLAENSSPGWACGKTVFPAGTFVRIQHSDCVKEAVYQADTFVMTGAGTELKFKAGTPGGVGEYSGKATGGVLAKNTLLSGVNFPAGTKVKLWHDGQVEQAELSGITNICGIDFRAGTRVDFAGRNELNKAELSADTTVDGWTFAGGSYLELHRNGKPKVGTLAANGSRDGTYAVGKKIYLNESGSVYMGELASDTRVKGALYKGGTVLETYGNGVVKCGTLAEDATFKYSVPGKYGYSQLLVLTAKLKSGTQVTLNDSGMIRDSGILAEDTDFDGPPVAGSIFNWIKIKAGTRVVLVQGRMSEGVLAADKYIEGTRFPAGTKIHFFYDWDGGWAGYIANPYPQLESAELSGDTRIRGILYKGGMPVSFFTGVRVLGRVSSGVLAAEKTIGKKKYPPGTIVNFDPMGKLTSGY